MVKRTPKHTPTPQMINYMLGVLLKPVSFWKRFGKESRDRKVYAKEISKAYAIEFAYGRKILQLCKHLQEFNEEFGEDLKSLKVKVNELLLQALAEDTNIENVLH